GLSEALEGAAEGSTQLAVPAASKAQFQQAASHQHHHKPPGSRKKSANAQSDAAADLDEFCPPGRTLNAFCDPPEPADGGPQQQQRHLRARAAAGAAVGAGAVQPALAAAAARRRRCRCRRYRLGRCCGANLSRLPARQQAAGGGCGCRCLGASGMTADRERPHAALGDGAAWQPPSTAAAQQPFLPPLWFQQLAELNDLGGSSKPAANRVLEKEMEDPVTSDYYYINLAAQTGPSASTPGIFPPCPSRCQLRNEDGQSANQPLFPAATPVRIKRFGRRAAELRMKRQPLAVLTTSVTSPIEAPTRGSMPTLSSAAPSRSHAPHRVSLLCVYAEIRQTVEKRYLTSSERREAHICVTEGARKAARSSVARDFLMRLRAALLAVRSQRPPPIESVLNSCDKDLLFSALRTFVNQPAEPAHCPWHSALPSAGYSSPTWLREAGSALPYRPDRAHRVFFCHESCPCIGSSTCCGPARAFLLGRAPTDRTAAGLVDRVGRRPRRAAVRLAGLPSPPLCATSSHLHLQSSSQQWMSWHSWSTCPWLPRCAPELENHEGLNDRDLAEFVINIAHRNRSFDAFKARLQQKGATFSTR
uniref:Protein kinase domain-containing protein n=1 Tax=Macrostomum lignano TaxID=282301 RepID=A0A1I8FQT1_9PLAT